MFTGKDLIALGYKPGHWFKDALVCANELLAQGASLDKIKTEVAKFAPPPPLALKEAGEIDFGINITAAGPDEEANVASVLSHMRALMRVPTAVKGAVMPDACPAG
jgi:tRNA-splicing ligase RtcB (3'-phosphate/5'-hydroxy nucleic acid ligase)